MRSSVYMCADHSHLHLCACMWMKQQASGPMSIQRLRQLLRLVLPSNAFFLPTLREDTKLRQQVRQWDAQGFVKGMIPDMIDE